MPFKSKLKYSGEELKQYLIKAAEEEKSYSEQGKEINCSKQFIKTLRQRYGLKETPREIKQKRKAKEYKDKWGVVSKKDILDTDKYTICREKFRNKKAYAKSRGIEFTVNFGDLIFPDYCPALGIKIDYFASNREENSPSFDRIDSSKGYVEGNVVVLSWRANRIKNDGTKEELLKIYNYLETISLNSCKSSKNMV